ncbi:MULTISPECIES: addiction module antidote protein [Neisseria]|uniref:Addiction module antidote protein n=2 Tax=Neisseria TaxID=482 RepID=A0A1X3CQ58_9NEIS|nr:MULTISPECIES: addiction module antidote protein [Neisseria]MBF0805006.1 putative addiction module antidote protein [Neisseria sp. 19428wB4_WF04]MDO1510384.1 putative addiction module antidote protein [Neisseria sp. MVDL19-042950]MDO1516553.1 putative addiction module antidote protein [Neisseria sp. MVDL18-041461]MDO1563654.1 putative addiction module antidote protein [Neisseria sp. MVDL20-010259]OSI09692.1 putative addiction module antidote protein [Neisseria zoodegmatis]
MTKTTITPFDPARYLQDEEDIALFLEAAAEEAIDANDNNILLQAINTAAKARGIMQVAKDAGVSRESLYKSLAPNAKPRFDTITKVLHALGVQMTFTAKPPQTAEKP